MWNNLRTILNLTYKELLHLLRDRVLLVFLIVMPVLQLVLIAEATGSGIRNVKLAVWDQDQSALSQQMITALDNTNEFQLAYRAASYAELTRLIEDGQATVAVIFPPGFERDALRPGVGATVQAIVDGTNVIAASNILSAVDGAVRDLSAQFVTGQSMTPPSRGIDVKLETAFNPTLSFRWSTQPTQLAFITYQLVLVVAAVGFVRERELGTIEQLVVTPISRLDLLLGKGLLGVLIGLLNFFLLYWTLRLVFQIPMEGSLILLTLLALLFIATEIGVGTLISLVIASQQQAILLVFMLAMIEITFSGLLVPTGSMPEFMQVLATVSPLQHFTSITRSVFLKGATLDMLWEHVLPMVGLALASLGTAWTLFMRAEEF